MNFFTLFYIFFRYVCYVVFSPSAALFRQYNFLFNFCQRGSVSTHTHATTAQSTLCSSHPLRSFSMPHSALIHSFGSEFV